MSIKYDMEADIIVIGSGAAGSAAAITAHDNGANVVILEKMPAPGGNTAVSGGNLTIPREPEKFAQYLKSITFGTTEPEIIDRFVEGLTEFPGWIKEMGGQLGPFPALETCSVFCPDVSFPGVPGGDVKVDRVGVQKSETLTSSVAGNRLFTILLRQLERRKIKVMLSTPAKELIKDQNGEIVGVIAQSEGKDISIKAKKGVIMACGGFENNPALRWEYLIPKPLLFYGNPGNTGDGIRMVQKVGGALWHMSAQSSKYGFKAPEYEAAFAVEFLSPGFIWVDKYGRRFAQEGHVELHRFWIPCSDFDYERCEYPRVPFYAIFDEEVRRRAPLCWGVSGYNMTLEKYKWSSDNSAEVKKGWITKTNSIPEMAKKLLMDESTLVNTIAKYNEYCKTGKDTDFGRPRERLKAIVGPPYYAIQVWPTLVNTQGGARHDKEARVLDADGKPIPRLYAAGEFGSNWGFLYQVSTNITEAVVFGRIAGRNAALSSSLE